jgi:acetoin utilization protein AcuB
MKKTKVGDWMTRNPVVIDARANVLEAMHLLKEKNIRRVPVLRDGKLVGILTERMLLTCSPGSSSSLDAWEANYLLARTQVTEVMNPTPNTVTPDVELADAAKLIHDRKLNGITVVDAQGELVGILTTTNALEALIYFAEEARRAK